MLDKLKKRFSQFQWKQNNLHNSDDVYALMKTNTYYFESTGYECSRQHCIDDIDRYPQSTTKEQKFYYGLYQHETLVAVLDWIEGYPHKDTLWIGLLVFNIHYQQLGLGSQIIQEMKLIAKEEGYSKIMLAVYENNEIAFQFWRSQQFKIIEIIEDEQKRLYKMQYTL